MSAAQECLDMQSGCHAAKILLGGIHGVKNVWCLSTLLLGCFMFVNVHRSKHSSIAKIWDRLLKYTLINMFNMWPFTIKPVSQILMVRPNLFGKHHENTLVNYVINHTPVS